MMAVKLKIQVAESTVAESSFIITTPVSL